MKGIILMMALILASNSTFAMGGKGDRQKKIEKFKTELNLTDEQMEKVSEIRKNRGGDHKENKKKLKAEKAAFREAMKNPNATNDELITKFESFQKLRNEHQQKKFAMMLEMRSILNPEQRAKFAAMKKKEYKGERRGKKNKQ